MEIWIVLRAYVYHRVYQRDYGVKRLEDDVCIVVDITEKVIERTLG